MLRRSGSPKGRLSQGIRQEGTQILHRRLSAANEIREAQDTTRKALVGFLSRRALIP